MAIALLLYLSVNLFYLTYFEWSFLFESYVTLIAVLPTFLSSGLLPHHI